MSIPLNINGTDYFYPEQGDINWGPDATDWAVAVTQGMLQKAGGLFQLIAEVDFGTTYGLKAVSYKSRTANVAQSGTLRLARTDFIAFRNQANSADLTLAVDSSDNLLFNGSPIGTIVSVSDTNSIDLTITGSDLSADLKLSAASASPSNQLVSLSIELDGLKAQIADSAIRAAITVADSATIDLTYSAGQISAAIVSNSIMNSMINSAAAIAYSKLNLTGSIVNADINASAAIAYSKLALSNSILNADINASAAIAYSKLAALTAARALVSDGSGFVSASSVTATELGYVSGVTSAIQTQLNSKITNPMTTGGDLIYGGASGSPMRLPNGSSGYVLTSSGGTSAPSWQPAAASGANTSLSNLTSTAINADLIMDLGAAATIATKTQSGASNSENLNLGTGPASQGGGSGNSGNLWLRTGDTNVGSGNSGTLTLSTGYVAGAASTGPVNISTGDASGAGTSGQISLTTGSTSGGTRGKIKFVDGTEGTAGHIWTSVDTAGNGRWQAAPAGGITALTGDVTASGTGSVTATIAAAAVTLAKMANLAANSIIGNNTGSPATPIALTGTQVTAMLDVMVGDSGSGGTKGLVPAPGAGDAAAGKYLKADGSWAAPPSGFANPMTTTGDLILGGAAGTPTRLGIGTNGQVLTSNGTTASWQTPGAGSGTVTSVDASVPSFLSISGNPITTSGTLAIGYSGTALPVANGGTGVTSVTTAPAATAFAGWDANSNLRANAFMPGFTTTATSAGTTTMTIASTQTQVWTGSTTRTVLLPTTGVIAGQQYTIYNRSTGVVTVQSSAGNTIQAMAANTNLTVTALVNTPTSAANWDASYAAKGNNGTATLAIPVALGGTGVTAVTTTPAASTFAGWDANVNMQANNFVSQQTSVATAGGTTTLTVTSDQNYLFTGSSTQTARLPVATTLSNGLSFMIRNKSTGAVTVQTSGTNTLAVLTTGQSGTFTCINTAGGTGTASWATEVTSATVPASYYSVSALSGNTTAVSGTTYLTNTSAARTITLPAAAANAYFIVKDVTGTASTNNITIARAASESIEGVAANYVISSNWSSTTFLSDGTNWFVV